MINLSDGERICAEALAFRLVGEVLSSRASDRVTLAAIAQVALSILGPNPSHDLRVFWEVELGIAAANEGAGAGMSGTGKTGGPG